MPTVHHPLARALSALLLVLFPIQVSGCVSWQTPPAPAPEVIGSKPGQTVRLTLADGSRVELQGATLVGDSIAGRRLAALGDTAVGTDGRVPQRIAMADVTRTEVQGSNTTGTVALVAGLGLTAVLLVAVAAAAGSSGGSTSFEPGPMSCPLVYSWDGHDWRLDSGTFGGAITPALARSDLDELVALVATEQTLELRVTGQRGETEFLDALGLLAVDHPVGTIAVPDARQDGSFHSVAAMAPPILARDDGGRDALAALRATDGWAWESSLTPRDETRREGVRDGVELTFTRRAGLERGMLVVEARNTPWAAALTGRLVRAMGSDALRWYDPATSATAAHGVGALLAREASLAVSVWRDGAWQPQGVVWEAGPEVGKRQVLPLDLRGIAETEVRVRLESAPAFWLIDGVALGEPGGAVATTPAPLLRASMPDTYDPAGLLALVDDRSVVFEAHDTLSLAFAEPPRVAGAARTYLVRTHGWYRVHGAEREVPDREQLAQLREPGPYPASTAAVRLMNRAIAALGQ